jgi:hypothetical protein
MQVSASDIHHYERRLELALSGLDKDQTISGKNRTLIQSYVKFRDAQGLSVPRQVRYIVAIIRSCTLYEMVGFFHYLEIEYRSNTSVMTGQRLIRGSANPVTPSAKGVYQRSKR